MDSEGFMKELLTKCMPVPRGTAIVCLQEHPDGNFTVGKAYRINAYRWGVGLRASARIRDNKRQRKDFNFIPTSKNYFWKYFRLEADN